MSQKGGRYFAATGNEIAEGKGGKNAGGRHCRGKKGRDSLDRGGRAEYKEALTF